MPYIFKDETGKIIGEARNDIEKGVLEARFSGEKHPHPIYGWAPKKDGTTTRPQDEALAQWELGGDPLPKVFFTVEEEQVDRRLRRTVNFFPWHSDGAGVNPDQIPEAYAQSVRDGVPTQFDSEGRAIFTSPGHRDRYLKANGLFDRKHGQRETSGPSSSLKRWR